MVRKIERYMMILLLFFAVIDSSYAQQLNVRCLFQGYIWGQNQVMVGVSDTVFANQIFDTVKVDLVNPLNGIVSYSTKAIVSRNGWLSINLPLSLVNSNQYISLKHRNCLKTWSASTILIDAISTTYDFTSSTSQAFGSNQIAFPVGMASIFSGDVNDDGLIDTLDLNIIDFDNVSGIFGDYILTDLNGDTFTAADDVVLCDNNYILYAPHEMSPFIATQISEINHGVPSLLITPNPISDKFRINVLIGNMKSCLIYDASGKLVYINTNQTKTIEINSTGFTSGIFTVNVVLENGTCLNKLCIIKH